MLLVLCRAHTLSCCVTLAHVRTRFRVAVILVTGKMIDYCISVGSGIYSIVEPVWSPDGRDLVIMANMQNSTNFDTLFVDLEEGSVTKIGENLVPRGWLVTSQK